MSAALAWYAYGVVPAPVELAFDAVVGVDPQFGVGLVACGAVAAVASRVRLAEFGAAALARNLEDRVWLERTALAHDAVVSHALTAGAVVPMRLCTIFSSRTQLVSMLREQEVRLRDDLERVRGRAEFSVKILADPAAVEGTVTKEGETSRAGEVASGPGRAYLARTQQRRSAREEAQALIDAAVGEAHEQLRRCACATALLRPQTTALSGHRGWMVHNGAYLVDVARADDFASVAGELAEAQRRRGLRLELTGPWAPYNFVTTGRVEP